MFRLNGSIQNVNNLFVGKLNRDFKSPPPPKSRPHAANSGATLLCVSEFYQKNSFTSRGERKF